MREKNILLWHFRSDLDQNFSWWSVSDPVNLNWDPQLSCASLAEDSVSLIMPFLRECWNDKALLWEQLAPAAAPWPDRARKAKRRSSYLDVILITIQQANICIAAIEATFWTLIIQKTESRIRSETDWIRTRSLKHRIPMWPEFIYRHHFFCPHIFQ